MMTGRWAGIFGVCTIIAGMLAVSPLAKAADDVLDPTVKAELQGIMDGVTGETKFTPPGPALDASSLKDKLIFTIPSSTSIPFCDVVDKQMDDFAKRLGMR